MSYGPETCNACPAWQSGIDYPLYYRGIANTRPANIDGACRYAEGHVDYGLNVRDVNCPKRRHEVTSAGALGPGEHRHKSQ